MMEITKESYQELKSYLRDLIISSRPYPDPKKDIIGWGTWNHDPIAIITRSDVISILNRYLQGELSGEDLNAWSESLFGRETIGYEEGYWGVLSWVLSDLILDNEIENIVTKEYVMNLLDRVQNAQYDSTEIQIEWEKLPFSD